MRPLQPDAQQNKNPRINPFSPLGKLQQNSQLIAPSWWMHGGTETSLPPSPRGARLNSRMLGRKGPVEGVLKRNGIGSGIFVFPALQLAGFHPSWETPRVFA